MITETQLTTLFSQHLDTLGIPRMHIAATLGLSRQGLRLTESRPLDIERFTTYLTKLGFEVKVDIQVKMKKASSR